jgi:hypothetical protein
MHKELRYQVKTHTISDMPRKKKYPANSPQNFFIFIYLFILLFKKMQYGNDIICKARSNMMMPIQKNSRLTCFSCLPQKVLAKFSQEK